MTSVPKRGPKTLQLPGAHFWRDPDSDDPDLSFRFLVPHGARITMTAPLVGFVLRLVDHDPPELHCQRMPDGWSLTAVVGLSQVYLSTRALRLPASSKWRARVGRLLDLPLRGLVRAHLSLEGEGGWDSTADAQRQSPASSPIWVKQHPPAQHFKQPFPVRIVLPGSSI
ncbi:MAG: hypothetical protein K0U84_02435 [Actinomycetia bacterium]|nr:hypothetical protein [Actinomycetes bacterium]